MGCRRVAAAINIHRDVAAAWVVWGWASYGRRPKQTHPAAAAAGCCDVVSYISTVNVAQSPAATSRNRDRSARETRNVDR